MVAILLATYNGEKFLPQVLDSILNQTFQNFKIFVHDDGSTDGTVELLAKYAERHPQKFVILEFPPMLSPKSNFLALMKNVNSELYMFADQDDIWNEEKIMTLVGEYKKKEDLSKPILFFSDMDVIDSNSRLIASSFYRYCNLNPTIKELNQVIAQNMIPGCTMMFNKKLRDEAIKFTNESSIIHHDWWITCVAAATGKIQFVDKKLLQYRLHANNVVGAKRDNRFYEIKLLIHKIKNKQISESKIRTERFVKQSLELKNVEISSEKNKELIKDLAGFADSNKLKRLQLFMRHRITRNKRNIWMYLNI